MEQLNNLRNLIDSIDDQLLELISSRANLAKEIGKFKKKNNVAIVDEKRENEIYQKIITKAQQKGLDKNAVKKIWQNIINISYRIEETQK